MSAVGEERSEGGEAGGGEGGECRWGDYGREGSVGGEAVGEGGECRWGSCGRGRWV